MKKSTKLLKWAVKRMQQCLHFLLTAFSPQASAVEPEQRPLNAALLGNIAAYWHRPLWSGTAPRSTARKQYLQAYRSSADDGNDHSKRLKPYTNHRHTHNRSVLTWLSMAFVVLFFGLAQNIQAQSGTAFRDFNGDGVQTGAEPGVQGIIVKLYGNAAPLPADQLIGTTVTAADGTYNFAVSVTGGRAANPGEKLRIEFEIPPTFECGLANQVDFTSVNGAVYGTSVQFVTGQQSNVNFALNYPGQWVENPNPDVFLPCYFFGDNVNGNAQVKSAAGLVAYKFLDHGIPVGHSSSTGAPAPKVLSTYEEVGALYGVAFSRQAKKIFTSAVMRRHSAFGPMGSGGIYMVDPYAAGEPTYNFLNLDAIGIATRGTGTYPTLITNPLDPGYIGVGDPGYNTSPVSTVVGTNTERGLNLTPFDPSTDHVAGDQVGKVSIGDIDISDDGRYLYIVNLFDRKLYEIDLLNPLAPSAPTTPTEAVGRVRSWDIPVPAIAVSDPRHGEHRPWGLKFYRGKLYVGLVLSGQNILGDVVSTVSTRGNPTIWEGDFLRGYVFEFDPSAPGGAFNTNPLLDFDFKYGRERSWIPWGYSTNPAHPSRYFTGDQREVAEPIIADIEFDDQGSMLIGLLDRKGHQYAINNNDYAGNIQDYEYATAGELLRATVTQTPSGCTYEIVTRTNGNGDPIADYYNDNLKHPESVQGPLAVLPGGGDAIAVWLDPIEIRSGGTIRLNNTTGAQVPNSAYEVTDDRFTLDGGTGDDATPSKANALGDVELSGEVAPLEIGNLVWADKDADGVQDGDERGIAGVTVQLFLGNVLVAQTTTSANGNYFFNDSNVNQGGENGLRPNTVYTIRIPAAQYNNGGVNGTPLQRMILTQSNIGGVGLPNFSDNDASLNAGIAEILASTADFGENDHTFDFGFIPVDYGDLPAPYHTTVADNGPSHQMGSVLKMGANVDYDNNGIPSATANGDDTETDGPSDYDATDDENGVTLPMFIRNKAENLVFPVVMNMTGSPAKLVGYFDWDGDGTFTGTNEMYSTTVIDGATTATLTGVTPPPGAVLNRPIGIRFRISTDAGFATNMSPDGALPDGEVEDYVATVMAFDFGDLNDILANTSGNPATPTVPADHRTLSIDNGPSHKLTTDAAGTTITLKIGARVDDELDGQPSTDAGKTTGGDNNNSTPTGGPNDEDGLDVNNLPLFIVTQTTNLVVPVMNMTNQDAKLTVYIDFDKNGDFGADEMFFVSVPNGVPSVTVPISVPLSAVLGQDVGLRMRLADADEPMSPNGPALSGEVEDYMVQIVGFDYGDLPNTYTTIDPNAPKHLISEDLKLGTCVDADLAGQPDPMAGSMGAGDDGNVGPVVFGTCTNGDDEDGIRFLTPMVPGYEACIEVTAMNTTGTAAVLQMWVDWDGSGTFSPGEAVNFLAGGGSIPSGGMSTQRFCFQVPADAAFAAGNAMVRFRLSSNGGLTPNSQAAPIPFGEIEDYKLPLGKIGNLVWNDTNFNGRQDMGEPGIPNQPVTVTWAGEDGNVTTTADNRSYPTTTDANGEYYVCGLIPGTYKIIVQTPADMTPTRANVAGNTLDVIDSDGAMTGMDFTMVMETVTLSSVTTLPTGENGLQDTLNIVGTFPDNQTDQTHDFGFSGLDYGDLPQEPQGEHFNTTMAENGPVHVLTDSLYLGQCADAERDGTPDDDAGAFDGKDGDQGVGDDGRSSNTGVGDDCTDDEDGIRFITPMIPGFDACIEVTYTAPAAGAVLQAWVDFNGNGLLDPTEALVFTGGGNLASGSDVVDTLCFQVPFGAVFNDGTAFVRFRLSPRGGLSPDGPSKFDELTIVPQGEVEDYMVKLAKVGNLVWEDRNWNGQQDDLEEDLGINGVVVALVYAGANGTIETNLSNASFPLTAVGDDRIYYDTTSNYTYTDASTKPGFYYFCGLIEGTYDVLVLGPKDLTPTRPNLVTNSQDEDKDSDGLETARNLSTQRTLSHSGTFTIDSQKEICELAEGEEGIGDQDLANLLDVNNVGTFPDDQVDQRFDFGFVALDFGDLPQEGQLTGIPGKDYNTTLNQNGPRHIVKPDFFLGKGVDAELDGTPDAQAGSGAYAISLGDDAADANPLSWKQGTGTDDEDGIEFLTPLVPGYEACIAIRYALPDNFNGPDGYLNAWIDWNGNDTLEAGEKLQWVKQDGNAAKVELNTGALELEKLDVTITPGKDSIIVCFKVPQNAAYYNGNILARFRLSENPRLNPEGILPAEAGYTNGKIPCGEVEDYFMKLSKVGNLVWEDRNYNGLQDVGEPPIKNVIITLEYAGIDTIFGNGALEYTYRDTTDADGRYSFCGLIGSLDPSGIAKPTYRLTAYDPASMTATFNNPDPSDDNGIANNSNGDDLLIDDRITRDTFSIINPMNLPVGELDPNGLKDQGKITTGPLVTNVFPDMQIDETRDFGYVGFDYGDLPIAGTNYLTLRDSVSAQFANKFGPRHAIQPKLYLGEGVDGELNGQPDADAGSKNGGDDDGQGKFKKGLTTDDESGVRLLSPLLPGELAYIKVTYTSQDTAANALSPNATGYVDKAAYLSAFIDFNGDGDLNDASDRLSFVAAGPSQSSLSTIPANNNPLMLGGVNQMQVFAFRVPNDAVYRDGNAFMRYRLSWEANVGPDNNFYHTATSPYVNTAQAYPRGEVEDYSVPVAKIGNLAWFDHDVKGDQNENDYVDTLQLVLVWGGVDELTGKFDTVGYQIRTTPTMYNDQGTIPDVLYNLSIVPIGAATMPPASNDVPGQVVRTNAQGRYSFQGLIPGNYYLVPLKYLQADSASFVNAWPRHRVLTLKDNPNVNDQNDSDGMAGAIIRINDGNARQPEVCVDPQPKNEAGNSDVADATAMNAMHPTGHPFPDSLYNQTIDFGWVDEPNIEANLDIVGVNYPTSQICGNFNVIMHLCVKNPQEVPLDSLQAFLDLKAAYGNALITKSAKVSIVDSAYVTSPAGVKVKKSQKGAKAQLVPNTNYDGENDLSLLKPLSENTDFVLKGDSIVCIRIEFEIDPSKTEKQPWSSQGSVTARAVGFNKQTGAKRPLINYFVKSPGFGRPIVVSDLTDEIDDPMPMANVAYPTAGDGIAFEGMVADRGFNGTYLPPFSAPNVTGRDKYLDQNDKAIQNDECWLKTKWNSGVRDVNIRLDENCQALVTADLLVPNHNYACGFDKYPEGSYYRVIIIDKKTERTIWSSAWRTPFDASAWLGRELVYEVKSVANHCNPLWGRLNFEDKSMPVVVCPPNTDHKYPSGTYTFVCTDIDSVFNVKKSWTDVDYAYYTGLATATDNCGTPVLDKVSDVLSIFAECNDQANHDYVYAQIARTFFFRDEFGNIGSCTQYIYFKRPTIVLPVCKVEVPANLAAGDTELKPVDLVNKDKYNLLESVPYYINGSGNRIHITGKDYCGLAFNYTDQSVFNIGECGRKIIRRWSIIDWCYGTGNAYPNYLIANGDCYANSGWNNNIYSWDQIIVVGDASAPVVKVKDQDHDHYIGTGYADAPQASPLKDNLAKKYDAGDVIEYSTGPMNCEASFLFTKDDFIVEEASKWNFSIVVLERKPIFDLDKLPTGEYEMKTPLSVKVTGDSDKGYTVTGLPMLKDSSRAYFIQVTVSNVCYGSTTILVPIRVVDRIAPVMVCDDKLVISRDNLGNAKVAAVDVNEGSSDNCGPIIWMKVRRPIGDCAASFMRMPRFVDANGNGKIDVYDPSIKDPQDYIDENRNKVADELEYFRLSNSGVLMSPMLDSVPFFCCDPASVMVELWGQDWMGNRSFCWNNITIEDKATPICIAPWEISIHCDDKNLAFIDSKVASAKVFGDVIISSGNQCLAVDTVYSVVKKLKCGAGTIERIWTITKQTGKGPVTVTCKQLIRVLPVREYNICFPKDANFDCKTPIIDTIKVDELACDLLAVNVSDKRYDATGDECYKIFRTYTVIDWCAYDDRCGDPMTLGNVFVVDRKTFVNDGKNPLYVLVRDRDYKVRLRPGTTANADPYLSTYPDVSPSPVTVPATGVLEYNGSSAETEFTRDGVEEFWISADLTVGNSSTFANGDNDATSDNNTKRDILVSKKMPYCANAFSDNQYGAQPGEFYHSFMYTQIIKVYDSERPVVTGTRDTFCTSPTACVATMTKVVNIKDNCTDRVELERQYLMIAPFQTTDAGLMIQYPTSTSRWSVKDLGNGNYEISVTNLPEGLHDLIVVGRDECGNLSVATRIPFVVKDCKAPAPICINGLSTELMPDGNNGGMMAVWAKDFVASPIYDCNGQGPETKDGLKVITKYSINRVGEAVNASQTGLNFTCADAGKVILVELHAWDERGNHDFCMTFVEIQDNRKVCVTNSNLGSISGLITTDELEPVLGARIEVSGGAQLNQTTSSTGGYNFVNLSKGSDFTITAQLDKDHLNGVSTFDLVLLQKHILGTQLINNPYRLIAADVNNSKSISTIDMIQIRKLILGLDSKFVSVPSWKFVDANYRFSAGANPWAESFPEVVNVNDLVGNVKADFVAIKMGDINGNASASGAIATETRGGKAMTLNTEEQTLKAGQSYEVAFRAKDLAQLQGFQFTLQVSDQVKIEGLDYGVMKAENFGLFTAEGLLTTSFHSASALANDAILFTLKLRANADINLSEVLKLNSRRTNIEAYNEHNEVMGVQLNFSSNAISDQAALYQNTPNPFADETSIGFYLPKATRATLTVRDVKGALIYKVEGNYTKGNNRLILKKEQLRASGVMYYTLETSDFTDTKKMVLMNR